VAPSDDGISFSSREGATLPELVITAAEASLPNPRSFVAEADARVEAGSATSNYGTSNILKVDSSPAIESYLRFTVAGVSGSVLDAKLRLYVGSNGTSNGPAVYTTDASWPETAITWNTRPSLGSTIVANVGATGTNGWVEYDVTSAVTGNGAYSFALVGESSDDVTFESRQGNNRPELVLTLAASTPTTTQRPPTPPTAPAAPGTARAALREALALVEAMSYAGPPAGAPSCLTSAVQATLRSSLDGTFTSDNTLVDGSTFALLQSAGACLQAIGLDGQAPQAARDSANQALGLVMLAARAIPQALLDGSALFEGSIPPVISAALQQAQTDISTGDQAYANQQVGQAIGSYHTAWTEASGAIDALWAAFDPDTDKLLDRFELILGTDVALSDTDGDGISDGDELTLTGSDPTVADSQDDQDGDGLTALEELAAGTNALRADTDDDTLDDRFELETFGSDPLRQDSDGDGLDDASEQRLGTNPLVADSDGDGTLDGQETYQSTAQGSDGTVAVEITGVGDVAGSAQLRLLAEETRFQALPGQIGTAVDITAEQPFTQARVKIAFDPAQVPNGDTANLRILYFDEAAGTFLPTDGAFGVDLAGGYAWADSSHFTTFVLFYIPNWNAVWSYQMEPGRDGTDPGVTNVDVMLVIDESSSMLTNDPQRLRVDAAKNFVTALIPNDRAGVIGFAYGSRMLQSLTADLPLTIAALDSIADNLSSTCVYNGLSHALDHLIANSTTGHSQLQIIITDGADTSNCGWPRAEYAGKAAYSGSLEIPIYTIGLGSSVDGELLQEIADLSGGEYYNIATAGDLPTVFRQIIEEPDPTLDSDGDRLPDWLEREGILLGNGTLLTTNPAEFDTDGDRLSDGEEVGNRQTGPQGDYYDGRTDPTKADTDGDGLNDDIELDFSTNPTSADSDGDTLSDGTELSARFHPLDANPDGDSYVDAQEFARDSDPFTYDLTELEHVAAVVAGFVLGEAGQHMVNLGLLPSAHLQSFGYIAGWLASGFFLIGDIRDTLAALLAGNLVDTFLNAIGLIPLLGDGSKVVRVVTKYLEWLPDARMALRDWLKKHFADASAILDDVLATLFTRCINSFSADTLVHTADGIRPIGELQAGEMILAYHEGLQQTGNYTVTATFSHVDPVIVELTLGDETIETTPEHPFYVLLRGWVEAENLRPGMRVYQADGEYGVVKHVELEQRVQRMYNLTVAQAHTFFVGEEAWLVHNTNCNLWNFADLPYRRGGVGPTSGYLVDAQGNRISNVYQSGNNPYSKDATLIRGESRLLSILDHVEAQIAGWMRDNGLDEAILVLNNHPCADARGQNNTCQRLLPYMLPPGARLRIIVPEGFDARGAYDEVFEGVP
jgi:hypothetical protein